MEFARSVLFIASVALTATALAQGPRIDRQTSGATRGQPAGGASGETAGAMQGPMAPDANAVEVTPAGTQRYLTDVRGRALYLLEGENAGSVRCNAACARVWPPMRDEANLAPRQLKRELVGSRKRADGSTQVTYDGHPLYYYVEDRGPGRATGHDVHDRWGEWYLVTPQGGKLEGEAAAQGASR